MTTYGFSDRRIPDLLRRNEGRLTELLRTGGKRVTNALPPTREWLFNNASGETVPARAVMRVTDVVEIAGRDGFEIDKPDGTNGLFVFNGRSSVANGDNGVCYVGPTALIGYDSGTPANGDVYGVSGWTASASGGSEVSIFIHGIADATDKIALGTVDNSTWGLVECTAGGTFTTASSTFSATVVAILAGYAPDAASSSITVNNSGGIFEGASSDTCLVLHFAGEYHLIQKEC